jgi:hypothetical protein
MRTRLACCTPCTPTNLLPSAADDHAWPVMRKAPYSARGYSELFFFPYSLQQTRMHKTCRNTRDNHNTVNIKPNVKIGAWSLIVRVIRGCVAESNLIKKTIRLPDGLVCAFRRLRTAVSHMKTNGTEL